MGGLFLSTLAALMLCALAPLAVLADENPFARGARTVQVYGAGSLGEDNDSVQRLVASLDYYFLDNVSVGASASLAYAAIDDAKDGFGGGVGVMLRWHALQGETWSLFVEGGSGPLFLTEKFPARTDQVNFASEGGVGFTRRLNAGNRLIGGARVMHISNAGLAGHNPGNDSAVFYLGVLFSK